MLVRARREFTVEPFESDSAEPFWDIAADPAPERVWTRSRRRLVTMAAIAGLVLIVGAIAGALLSRARGSVAVEAVFNAPMLVLRAAQAGRVIGIAVKPGQKVDPASLLLTLQTAASADPVETAARNRMLVAQRRMAAYDNAVSQPVPAGEESRQHLVELFRARDAAAAELAAAQDVVAHLTAANPVNLPVTSGTHGVVWSLEIQPGTEAPAGTPLVRIVDCDHAFFTIKSASGLKAGQQVEIRLPNSAALLATVRPAAGVAEPANALVVAPEPGAFGSTCPLGASASVSLVKATS